MEIKLYLILLIYSLIGGITMIFITKNKETDFRKKNWLKYFVYIFVLNILFITILVIPDYFHYISLIIIAGGFLELLFNTFKTKKISTGFISIVIFSAFSILFYFFSFHNKEYLFYTLFLTTVFDSFSQLSGQLFGKRKLVPKISPNKTVEGLIGGFSATVITAVLIHNMLSINSFISLLLGAGLSISALTGDLLASICKRKLNIKDFSNLIPGNGGILDRFDSFILTGAFMFLIIKLIEI